MRRKRDVSADPNAPGCPGRSPPPLYPGHGGGEATGRGGSDSRRRCCGYSCLACSPRETPRRIPFWPRSGRRMRESGPHRPAPRRSPARFPIRSTHRARRNWNGNSLAHAGFGLDKSLRSVRPRPWLTRTCASCPWRPRAPSRSAWTGVRPRFNDSPSGQGIRAPSPPDTRQAMRLPRLRSSLFCLVKPPFVGSVTREMLAYPPLPNHTKYVSSTQAGQAQHRLTPVCCADVARLCENTPPTRFLLLIQFQSAHACPACGVLTKSSEP